MVTCRHRRGRRRFAWRLPLDRSHRPPPPSLLGGRRPASAGRRPGPPAGRAIGPSRRRWRAPADGPPLAPAPAVLLEPDPCCDRRSRSPCGSSASSPGSPRRRVVFVNLGGLGACPSRSFGERTREPPWGHASARRPSRGRPRRRLRGRASAHRCGARPARLLRAGPGAARPGGTGLLLTTLLVPPALELAGPTPREADVLALLLAGATDRVAAERSAWRRRPCGRTRGRSCARSGSPTARACGGSIRGGARVVRRHELPLVGARGGPARGLRACRRRFAEDPTVVLRPRAQG